MTEMSVEEFHPYATVTCKIKNISEFFRYLSVAVRNNFFSAHENLSDFFKIISDDRCIADVSHQMAANTLEPNPNKTELLWAGSKYGPALLGRRGPPLQLR